jgi:phage nucleotide-binding protein
VSDISKLQPVEHKIVLPPKREVLTMQNFGGLKVASAGQSSRTFNQLIYGEAGVGKTQLAASAHAVPEMAPVLYVDAEAGSSTIKSVYPDVPLVTTTEWEQYNQLYHALKAGGHPYKTVVLDSISEINEHCKTQVMKEMLLDPENERRDPDIPSIREWGKLQVRMMRMIRLYRDLPMNVIFIAHAEQVQLKNGKKKWMPLINGKMQMKLPQIPDVVLFMYVQEVDGEQRRLLLTTQTDNAVAKVRGVNMPQILGAEESVTMSHIINYYHK